MSDKDQDKNEFGQPDPLDQDQGQGSGDFISESTLIADSSLVFPEDDGNSGPDLMEGEGIPESVSTDAAELPGAKEGKGGGLKKNMPFIVFGAVAAVIVGSVGFKMMSGAGGEQQAYTPPPAKAAPAPQPAPVEVAKAPEVPAPAPEPAVSAAAPVAAAPVVDPVTPEPVKSANAPVAAPVSAPVAAAAPVDDLYSTRGLNLPKTAPVMPSMVKDPAPMAQNAAQCAPVTPLPKCDAGLDKPVKVAKVVKKSAGPKVVKVAKVKKVAEPLPSTEGYEVHMGANGLAWVTLPGGERRIVTEGDRIEGLGVVAKVDSENHLIRVGRVTLR
jgi:hypothetical protein